MKMFGRFAVTFAIIFGNQVQADVSHLKSLTASTNNNHYSAFNGYYYDRPSQSLPSPAPPPSSTTFIPEIVANKGTIIVKNRQFIRLMMQTFILISLEDCLQSSKIRWIMNVQPFRIESISRVEFIFPFSLLLLMASHI